MKSDQNFQTSRKLSVRKRDGTIVPFDKHKIESAIWRAARAVGGKDPKKATENADEVIQICLNRVNSGQIGAIVDVETIQDTVEKVLIENRHAKTAKAYILYRRAHEELRDVRGLFDSVKLIDDYVTMEDWMVKENSNMGYSLQGLNNYLSTKIVSQYWLHRIYSPELCRAHDSGDLHIHDLGTLGAYCVGWDLQDLLMTGFTGISGKTASRPPKHFRTALGQIVNFFYTLQGETAGAQAFSNVDTLLAPFIRHDGLNYEQVKQAMQEFIFNMNVPTRVGFQTPFTNITLDLKIPDFLKRSPIVIGGVMQKSCYGEYQNEVDMFNQAFAEVMLAGDASGSIFSFPIPTYNVTKDFDWENPSYEKLWEMTAKYGIPYFSNFVSSDMKPEDARSMCCRLRLDQKELRKRGGGLFGANPQTGSIGVVTLNMPAIGYSAKTEKQFYELLSSRMDLAYQSLETKRKAIENFTLQGLYPYCKFYLRTVNERFSQYWKNHFSTIGLLGMNEAIVNFMPGEDISTLKGQKFAHDVLVFMRERLTHYQTQSGNMYNLEATPGEAVAYRFARLDKKRFTNVHVANDAAVARGGQPFYTNSTQLPVSHTDNIFDAFTLQEPLQTLYTGGTVIHGFVGEKIPPAMVRHLVKKIAETFSVPYFTLTPTFSICPIHGYMTGDYEYCPQCDAVLKRNETVDNNASNAQFIDEKKAEVENGINGIMPTKI